MALSVDSIAAAVWEFVGQHSTQSQLMVGFSGGIDSCTLLHLLVRGAQQQAQIAQADPTHNVAPAPQIIAVHVHHGLQQQADEWATFCAQQAQALDIAFVCKHVQLHSMPQGMEASAREARYTAFCEVAVAYKCHTLLTAHHQDDQLETMLMRLFRGAGVTGMQGIPQVGQYQQLTVLRPLLNYPKDDINRLASALNCQWREDPSNQNSDMDRNWLRNEVIPHIKQRWPQAAAASARTAHWMLEAEQLQASHTQADLAAASVPVVCALDIGMLQQWEPPRIKAVLRQWLQLNAAPACPFRKLNTVLEQCIFNDRVDAQPMVAWQGWSLRRFQQQLYLLNEQTLLPIQDYNWRQPLLFRQPLQLPNGLGHLTWVAAAKGQVGISLETIKQSDIFVQFRGHTGSQALTRYLTNNNQHRALKDFLREQAIAPWLRPQTPLLVANGSVLAIADMLICGKQKKTTSAEVVYRIEWQRA